MSVDTVSLKEYLEKLREADQKAVSAALAAAEKAVAVAERNAEKWRDNANEWRAAMQDRERNFLSRGMGYVVGVLAIATALFQFFSPFTKG